LLLRHTTVGLTKVSTPLASSFQADLSWHQIWWISIRCVLLCPHHNHTPISLLVFTSGPSRHVNSVCTHHTSTSFKLLVHLILFSSLRSHRLPFSDALVRWCLHYLVAMAAPSILLCLLISPLPVRLDFPLEQIFPSQFSRPTSLHCWRQRVRKICTVLVMVALMDSVNPSLA
jgi:hypothetical protein